MKPDAHKPLEKYRMKNVGRWSSDESCGNNGAFQLPILKAADGSIHFGDHKHCHCSLRLVVSDGEGWDHVSVSLENRCPSWAEMCFVKDLFFGAEECVMQLHPPRSQYVNYHPNCLHLWRPYNRSIPLPPSIFVGPK
jgi:hypothetical protein